MTFVDGKCISTLANGEKWENWMGKAIACPVELPFGTKVVIDNKEWICKDRGEAVFYDGDSYWVDQLLENPEYAYGTVVEAVMYKP